MLRIMGHMETHKAWFLRLTGESSGRQAAIKADISISTLNRQLAKGEISADYVIALARAYGGSVTGALVSTGYLYPHETAYQSLTDAAEILSDQALIRELARRIDSDPAAWFGTFGELEEDSTDVQDKVYDLDDRGKDDLIDRINAGLEPVAAQEATEPLEEHQP